MYTIAIEGIHVEKDHKQKKGTFFPTGSELHFSQQKYGQLLLLYLTCQIKHLFGSIYDIKKRQEVYSSALFSTLKLKWQLMF